MATGGVSMYKHSRWSVGEFISHETIRKNWTLTNIIQSNIVNEEESPDRDDFQISITNGEESPVQDKEPDLPAPCYRLYRSSLKGLASLRVVSESTRGYQQREEDGRDLKKQKENQKLVEDDITREATIKKSGLYWCTAVDHHNRRCTNTFLSLKNFEKHIKEAKHSFPSLSGIDMAFKMATESGGILSTGSFINRSVAMKKVLNLEEVILATDCDWCQEGCYNRPKRKHVQRMTAALKLDLDTMFTKGLQTAAKISAQNAVIALQEMKTSEGKFKYTYNDSSHNGPPPEVSQVKSYFSGLSLRLRKGVPEKESKLLIKDIERILEERGLPHKSCENHLLLQSILHHCDLLGIHEDSECVVTEGDNNGEIDYSCLKVKQLEAAISHRGFTEKTRKTRLELLLRLSNMVDEENS